MALFIGLMSGTSMDSIDAVLVEIDDNSVLVKGAVSVGYPAALRGALERALDTERLSAREYWRLDARLGEQFASVALELLAATGTLADDVTAIGSHGQTIYHAPDERPPVTIQAADPNIIAERTGITTVADFRRRDIAAGGQGAPLASAFHAAVFGDSGEPRVILNVGGIANLTVLPDETPESASGFDSGPGNTLIDSWIEAHRGERFDRDGVWARSGQKDEDLLRALLADPWFAQAPPKSTGRDRFNLAWLRERAPSIDGLKPEDVQRSLCVLTARSAANAMRAHVGTPPPAALYVCGGGARNPVLMEALREAMPEVRVATTATLGVDPMLVEGLAFAWLAARTLSGAAGNLPAVTGARGSRVLGSVYAR